MLTSKQRAALKSIASTEDTILQVGKNGIVDTLVIQVSDALKAREIVKMKVLEGAMLSPAEAAAELAEKTKSEVVQVIGKKIVLYREGKKEKKKIILP